MSKRKPMDKAQVRERRNKLLDSAAAAELSLTEGVREMRAIAGMTQEEFAKHRGVSARVIKAIELGQGNPTVATLERFSGWKWLSCLSSEKHWRSRDRPPTGWNAHLFVTKT
jgi:DNA-binding XRE family transcriptional regulator